MNKVHRFFSPTRTRLPVLIMFFLSMMVVVSTAPLMAQSEPEGPSGAEISESLFKHVTDGESFEPLPFLPPVELPLGLTVHRLMLVLVVLLIGGIFAFTFWRPKIRPGRLALALEKLILFVRDDIVVPVMGETRGQRWLPFFFTLFMFILAANFLGLIPAFKTATGNFSVTTALSLMILVLMFVEGIRSSGFAGFFRHMYPEGSPPPIGIFVALLELLGTFIKTAVLSLRLFANMFAGHLAILSFIVLMFILDNPAMGAISIPFAIFTYALEVLVAFIQAYVFTLLGCIFISMLSSSHEHI